MEPGLNACDVRTGTKCAFNVSRFVGYKWRSTVGYLHFRNFHPDEGKLLQEAEACAEGAAYCCQCAWVDAGPIVREVSPDADGDPRWINC